MIFKRVHLKTALIIPFVILTILAVSLVGYISFLNGQKAVNNVALQLRSRISEHIESHLSNFIKIPQQINQLNSDSMQKNWIDVNKPEILEYNFWKQIQTFQTVTSIYFGNTQGGLVNSGREGARGSQYIITTDGFKSGDFNKYSIDEEGNRSKLLLTVKNFDARTRQWYIKAVEKGTCVWSSVYILFTGQDLAIAASRPVYDKHNNLLGVTSVDLFLSHFTDFLKTLSIGKSGSAFIIERSGLMIATSNDEKLFTNPLNKKERRRLKATESETTLIRSAAKSLIRQFGDLNTITEKHNIDFEISGQNNFLQVSPLKDEHGLDWLVVVAVPEADFMKQIEANNILTVILIIISLSIVLPVGIFTAQSIAKPVLRINDAADKLAKGELKQKIKNNSPFIEINNLTRSFNYMATQLHEMLNDLNCEIEERKQTEKFLQESEETFKAIVGYVPVMIDSFNDNGECTIWNKEAEKQLGYSLSEINDAENPLELFYSKEEALEVFQCIMKKDGKFRPYCVTAKNGERKYQEWANVSLPDGRSVSIGIDLTEQKKLEEQALNSQKMESIGNLAGGIAHDFNNLLFPIMGMAELLLDDLPKESLEHENAQEIFTAANRAGDLVKQILAFSRQAEHKVEPVRVQNVVNEVLKLSRSTIPMDIEIQQDIQAECESIKGDASKIHQVVLNLITNAYHAVQEKSGIINVNLRQITLGPGDLINSSLVHGKYIELTVADNGAGIESSIIKKIFDPYFTTKEQGKGTGLGLAVAFGIIKEHQGDIKVYSEIAKGTTFKVYFPVMQKYVETNSADSIRKISTGTERILLVDDEVSVVKLEKQMLSRLGYSVIEHTTSLGALRVFKENPEIFDIVITDMTMPNMNGAQLAKEILSIKPDIPIIICTGFSERISKEQAELIGVKGFLMKPVVKSDMAQMVRKVLEEENKS